MNCNPIHVYDLVKILLKQKQKLNWCHILLLDFILIGFGQLVKERLLGGLIGALQESSVNDIFNLYNVENLRLVIAKPYGLTQEEFNYIKSNMPKEIIIETVDVREKQNLNHVINRLEESKHSIVYIAAPNYTHAGYIDLFLRRASRIFVEKPLCNNLKEIETLLKKHSEDELNKVRMIDHYLYKPAVHELIYNFHNYYELTGEIEEFEFKILLEKPYEEHRQWLYLSGVIRDLFTHNLSIIFKLNELYPKVVPLGSIKIQSVKKGLYDLDSLDYKIKYEEEKLKETYANIKLRIGDITLKSEVGVGVDKQEKLLGLKGEKGKIILDLQNNLILHAENGLKIIYEGKSIANEYKRLMWDILTGGRSIGLDFQHAKLEVEIFEMLDKYNALKRYKIGSKPRSILGL